MIWTGRKLGFCTGKLLLACLLEILEKKTPECQGATGTPDIWVDPVKHSKSSLLF